MFLDHEELVKLTGYNLVGWQVKWLKDNRYIFELNAKEEPVVSRSYVEFRLGGTNAAPERKRTEVNLEGVS